ncbi:unnamed protein product [Moneuplotes crassus]|uniref:Uncharacterized protein n=1 Tax=Euplotes crassus TaxID=5936 RepID=A0AAD2DBH4_EUPCR|nr:unnamed protein product [Moneuplotes crassus]
MNDKDKRSPKKIIKTKIRLISSINMHITKTIYAPLISHHKRIIHNSN